MLFLYSLLFLQHTLLPVTQPVTYFRIVFNVASLPRYLSRGFLHF